jgi:hypothetical protein
MCQLSIPIFSNRGPPTIFLLPVSRMKLSINIGSFESSTDLNSLVTGTCKLKNFRDRMGI